MSRFILTLSLQTYKMKIVYILDIIYNVKLHQKSYISKINILFAFARTYTILFDYIPLKYIKPF
ncbi:MAG: hypothetical protein RR263_03020, partial [Oscillospiraceae bacterium]